MLTSAIVWLASICTSLMVWNLHFGCTGISDGTIWFTDGEFATYIAEHPSSTYRVKQLGQFNAAFKTTFDSFRFGGDWPRVLHWPNATPSSSRTMYVMPIGPIVTFVLFCYILCLAFVRKRDEDIKCKICFYPLVGLADMGKCPECGRPYTSKKCERR